MEPAMVKINVCDEINETLDIRIKRKESKNVPRYYHYGTVVEGHRGGEKRESEREKEKTQKGDVNLSTGLKFDSES